MGVMPVRCLGGVTLDGNQRRSLGVELSPPALMRPTQSLDTGIVT
jgi:hypothetical protein